VNRSKDLNAYGQREKERVREIMEFFKIDLPVNHRYLLWNDGQAAYTFNAKLGADLVAPRAVRRQMICKEFNHF